MICTNDLNCLKNDIKYIAGVDISFWGDMTIEYVELWPMTVKLYMKSMNILF